MVQAVSSWFLAVSDAKTRPLNLNSGLEVILVGQYHQCCLRIGKSTFIWEGISLHPVPVALQMLQMLQTLQMIVGAAYESSGVIHSLQLSARWDPGNVFGLRLLWGRPSDSLYILYQSKHHRTLVRGSSEVVATKKSGCHHPCWLE